MKRSMVCLVLGLLSVAIVFHWATSVQSSFSTEVLFSSVEEQREVRGGEECYVEDYLSCSSEQPCYTFTGPEYCSGSMHKCSQDEGKFWNIVPHTYAHAKKQTDVGKCDVSNDPEITCFARYDCDVDCEYDETLEKWLCMGTEYLEGYSGYHTPTVPSGKDCPNCPPLANLKLPSSIKTIAFLNGLSLQ